MNTKEWLTSIEPQQMLTAVASRASTRKLRLFGCACCRRIWPYLEDERSRTAIELAERYADSGVAKGALSAAQSHAARAVQRWLAPPAGTATIPNLLRSWAAAAARYASQATDHIPKLTKILGYAAHYALFADSHGSRDTLDAQIHQCALLRDIFGNPFRPVGFSPEWRTDTAVALAKQMYESRDFGAMPILADALQDAGCDNGDILTHCRDPHAVHVRGCWVVDLVSGKQ